MKKLISTFSLILLIFCVKAQNKPSNDTAFVKVNYYAEIAGKAERAAEIKHRQALYAEKVAQTYTLVGIFQNPANQKPGRYAVFVKRK